jgi:acetolactate synthase small subunit
VKYSRNEERVTFEITTENTPNVLHRVVMLLHRLQVEIHAVSMVRRERAETTRIFVTTLAKGEKVPRIEASLSNLVEVRGVSIQRAGEKHATAED